MNGSQLADAFLALGVDSTARATALLVLACIAARLLRRSSAALRHRLWALALCGLIAMPAASRLPGWQLPRLSVPAPAIRTAAVETPGPPATVSSRPVPGSQAARVSTPRLEPVPLVSGRLEPVVSARHEVLSPAIAPRADRAPQARWTWPSVGLVVWCAGFLVVLVPTLGGLVANELWRRRSRPVTTWSSLVETVCRQFSIRRRVELRQGGPALVPLTWGVLRPVVLLPEYASGWPEATRRRVLLHELAHVRRLDAGIQLAGRVTAALYWFHPLAWYALHRLRLECELACDDCVVQAGERPTEYARQLLDFVTALRAPRFSTAVAMTRTSALEQRMLALFDDDRSHLPLDRRTGRGMLAASLVLVLGFATLQTQGPNATADEPPAVPKGASASTAAPATGRITGRVVVDKDGSVAAGAEVILLLPPPAGQNHYTVKYPLRRVPAGANGEFTFDELPPGRYRVWANRGRLTSRVRRADGQVVVLSSGGEAPGPVELRLSPGVELRVRVTDRANGDPIAGATVHMVWSDFAADPTTDRDGRALLQALRAEKSDVQAWAEGYARQSLSINLESGADAGLEFQLGPGGHLEGVVRDPSGKPLAGVGLSTHYSGKHEQIAYVKTDDHGHYRLENLPRGADLEISVSKTEFERKAVQARVTAGTVKLDLELKPRPHGGSIVGVVLDHRGQPIAGAELVNMGGSSTEVRATKTGADGRFRLDNLYASTTLGKEVLVRARGSAPKRQKVETGPADRPAENTITLDAGHRIRGRVVDEKGRPLEGVSVYFAQGNHAFSNGGSGTTDKDGRFAFDSLPPGCPFTFVKSGYSEIEDRPLALDTDELVTVSMVSAGVIAGKVVDATTGKPIRSFNVRITFSPKRLPGDVTGGLWSELSDPGQNYQSDEGRFELGRLKAGMPLQVTVSADGYEKAVAERVVIARPDELRAQDYRLQPTDLTALRTYRGQIFDAQGRPIAGAQLRLFAAHDRNAQDRSAFPFNWDMIHSGQLAGQSNVTRFLEASSDGKGEFAFTQVPRKGEVELVWWGRGVVPGRSDHLERLDDEAADSLRIVTPAPARIVGTWDRQAFPRAARVWVSSPSGLSLPSTEQELAADRHEFELGNLPPGSYLVVLYGPYERIDDGDTFTAKTLASQNVELRPGETRRVEFRK